MTPTTAGGERSRADRWPRRRELPPRAWAALTAILALACLFPLGVGNSWHFFRLGTQLLVSGTARGGVHLFAAHPELQIGPLTFLAAVPTLALPVSGGEALAVLVMTAVGLLLVGHVSALRVGGPMGRAGFFVAAALFLPVWTDLSWHSGHLDDVLAIACVTAALSARRRRHLVVTALALAGAVDAKPWAAVFLPLLLDRDSPVRRSAAAAAVAGAGILLVWSPFLLGDPSTAAHLAGFTIRVAPDSALRVLDVTAARTPGWDRGAQLGIGLVLVAVAVWRRRIFAVPLIGVSVRLLLDPQTHAYYAAGLVWAALLFDVLGSRSRLPWTTAIATVLIAVPHHLVFGLHLSGTALAGIAGTPAPAHHARAVRPGARGRTAGPGASRRGRPSRRPYQGPDQQEYRTAGRDAGARG